MSNKLKETWNRMVEITATANDLGEYEKLFYDWRKKGFDTEFPQKEEILNFIKTAANSAYASMYWENLNFQKNIDPEIKKKALEYYTNSPGSTSHLAVYWFEKDFDESFDEDIKNLCYHYYENNITYLYKSLMHYKDNIKKVKPGSRIEQILFNFFKDKAPFSGYAYLKRANVKNPEFRDFILEFMQNHPNDLYNDYKDGNLSNFPEAIGFIKGYIGKDGERAYDFWKNRKFSDTTDDFIKKAAIDYVKEHYLVIIGDWTRSKANREYIPKELDEIVLQKLIEIPKAAYVNWRHLNFSDNIEERIKQSAFKYMISDPSSAETYFKMKKYNDNIDPKVKEVAMEYIRTAYDLSIDYWKFKKFSNNTDPIIKQTALKSITQDFNKKIYDRLYNYWSDIGFIDIENEEVKNMFMTIVKSTPYYGMGYWAAKDYDENVDQEIKNKAIDHYQPSEAFQIWRKKGFINTPKEIIELAKKAFFLSDEDYDDEKSYLQFLIAMKDMDISGFDVDKFVKEKDLQDWWNHWYLTPRKNADTYNRMFNGYCLHTTSDAKVLLEMQDKNEYDKEQELCITTLASNRVFREDEDILIGKSVIRLLYKFDCYSYLLTSDNPQNYRYATKNVEKLNEELSTYLKTFSGKETEDPMYHDEGLAMPSNTTWFATNNRSLALKHDLLYVAPKQLQNIIKDQKNYVKSIELLYSKYMNFEDIPEEQPILRENLKKIFK